MDTESFKKLFLPLHPKLYRIAFSFTENSLDAEDILQEAYCKLWKKRDEISYINNHEAFCVTLVKNLCLDFLRSSKKSYDEDISEVAFLSDDVSPETEMIEQDELQNMQQIIEKLPENQRLVIRLKGMDDCSMEEIEEITGLSAVNIRVLLSRARKMIREQYNKLACYER